MRSLRIGSANELVELHLFFKRCIDCDRAGRWIDADRCAGDRKRGLKLIANGRTLMKAIRLRQGSALGKHLAPNLLAGFGRFTIERSRRLSSIETVGSGVAFAFMIAAFSLGY